MEYGGTSVERGEGEAARAQIPARSSVAFACAASLEGQRWHQCRIIMATPQRSPKHWQLTTDGTRGITNVTCRYSQLFFRANPSIKWMYSTVFNSVQPRIFLRSNRRP